MGSERIVFKVTLGELAEVPGSPFSYWAPKSLRELFKKFPPLDRDVARRPDQPKIADVKQGLATADDLRFTRYWWEVATEKIAISREETIQGKKWVPFAKGGKPFYHDIQLVVNWGNNGEEIRNFNNAIIRNESFYFRAGLAWTKSAWVTGDPRIDVGVLPAGCIFTAKRMGIFIGSSVQKSFSLAGLLRSLLPVALLNLVNPTQRNREAGQISALPINEAGLDAEQLAMLFCQAHDLLREW